MLLRHVVYRFLIWGWVFAATLHAQTALEAFGNKVPLQTQSYDYSYKAKRAIFDNALPQARFERLDGTHIVKKKQTLHEIPVWGAELVEIYLDDQLLAKTGHFAHLYTLKTEPSLSATQAIDQIATFFQNTNATAELWIYPARGRSHLVWLIKENNMASNWFVFIDAHTGEIVNAYQSIHTGTGNGTLGDSKEVESSGSTGNYVLDHTEHGVRRRTYSAGNSQTLPGTLSSDADDAWTGSEQGPAVDAHHYAGLTLDFLREHLNRNSYNGNGAEVRSTVNYGVNYVNAFWNGNQMVYGDGDGFTAISLAASFDVVAHEIGHALTEYTSGLIYQNESGALNEAFSDIIGIAAEYYYQPDQFDWMIGEDCWTPAIGGDALRYVNDPAADGSSRDHRLSSYRGFADNGGVHINSGLGNLAFYLAVEGGTHPRALNYQNGHIEVFGIGMEAALNIFYTGFTSLAPSARFIDARNACITAANNLYGEYEAIAVTNAWAAVGVGEAEENGLPNNGVLARDIVLSGLRAEAGEWLQLRVDVPINATNLHIRTYGGTGDADLYTRFNAEPTTSEFTQRPYRSGNDELVVEAAPAVGTWFIGLRAYTPFQDVSVSVAYDLPDDDDAALPNETLAVTDLNHSEGEWQHFTVEVYQSGPMQITMNGGDGDADMYVKYAEQPSITAWDYRPFAFGNNETIDIDHATTGTWHISIHAAEAYSDVSLTVGYP